MKAQRWLSGVALAAPLATLTTLATATLATATLATAQPGGGSTSLGGGSTGGSGDPSTWFAGPSSGFGCPTNPLWTYAGGGVKITSVTTCIQSGWANGGPVYYRGMHCQGYFRLPQLQAGETGQRYRFTYSVLDEFGGYTSHTSDWYYSSDAVPATEMFDFYMFPGDPPFPTSSWAVGDYLWSVTVETQDDMFWVSGYASDSYLATVWY